MKKLLVVLMVLLSMNVFANDFGVKVGLNYSLFSGEADSNKENTFNDSFGGFTIGGFYNITVNEFLSLKTELLLSKDLYPTIYCHSASNTYETYNLKIPFLLNLTSKYINIYGGGYYSRIVIKTESGAGNWFDKDDYGLIGGISLNINQNMFIDGRIHLGKNIYKDTASVYNRSLELSVGYSF